MNIEMNSDNVVKIQSQINEKINDFYVEINKLSNVIDKINTAWTGADALRYINVMKEKNLIELHKLESLLKEYNEFLRKVPQAYDLLDEIYSSKSMGE